MLDSQDILLILLVLLGCQFLPINFLSIFISILPTRLRKHIDFDPPNESRALHLVNQTFISPVRLPGESSVYRKKMVLVSSLKNPVPSLEEASRTLKSAIGSLLLQEEGLKSNDFVFLGVPDKTIESAATQVGATLISDDGKNTPTVMVVDTQQAREWLITKTNELSIFGQLKLLFGRAMLSRGGMPRRPSTGVRLIYIVQKPTDKDLLNSQEFIDLVVLTNSNVIRHMCIPGITGTALETMPGDYRLNRQNDETGYINVGTVTNSLEGKVVYDDEDVEEGELQLRGYVTDLKFDQWMGTGIKGTFGVDGCFRIKI